MIDKVKLGRTLLGRRALLGSAAGAAAFGLTGAAHAQKPLVIGFIYVGPRDDYGYNQARSPHPWHDAPPGLHTTRPETDRVAKAGTK